MGITDLSPTLYTYLSLSTVYRKCNRREYRPVQNPLPSNLEPLILLRTTTDLSRPPMKTPYRPANHYGTVNYFYGPPQDLPYPLRTTLHYPEWQISASKLAKVKRSGVRESTLRLRTASTTISNLKPLNTDTISF